MHYYKYIISKDGNKFYYRKNGLTAPWYRVPDEVGRKGLQNFQKNIGVPSAAGIVVLRKFGDNIKILALEGYEKYINKIDYNNGRIYDIPKGKIEPGESTLQAAKRETEEESSITKLNFKWGFNKVYKDKSSKKQLVVFIALTKQNPKIKKNPVTGIYEHKDAKWVSFDTMKRKTYGYLVPIIEWAENTINKKKYNLDF